MVGLIINFKIVMSINNILRYLCELNGLLNSAQGPRLRTVVYGTRLGAWRSVRKSVGMETMKNRSGDNLK